MGTEKDRSAVLEVDEDRRGFSLQRSSQDYLSDLLN